MSSETPEETSTLPHDDKAPRQVTLRRFPRPMLAFSLLALLYAVVVPLVGVHEMMGHTIHTSSAWAAWVVASPAAWLVGALLLIALLDWRAAQIPGASQTQNWRLNRTAIAVTFTTAVTLMVQLLTGLHSTEVSFFATVLLVWGFLMASGSTVGLVNWYHRHAPRQRRRARYFRAYLPLALAGIPVSAYCVAWTISGSTRFGF